MHYDFVNHREVNPLETIVQFFIAPSSMDSMKNLKLNDKLQDELLPALKAGRWNGYIVTLFPIAMLTNEVCNIYWNGPKNLKIYVQDEHCIATVYAVIENAGTLRITTVLQGCHHGWINNPSCKCNTGWYSK